jgi:1,2-phenylacetyl-CoA epoxidase PaaB subunit
VNQEYEVFGRIGRGDLLAHIGTVEAPTDELAQVYAAYTYDEEDWFELFVVPRKSMVKVIGREGLFAKEGAANHG